MQAADSWVDFAGAKVLEVGAYDVNGRARDAVTGWESWVGCDLLPGPDVDLAGDACVVLADYRDEFDVAVTTEVLEHAENWQSILTVMVQALKPGGWLLITCAGTGRPAHSADGSGPPHPGEYYANVSAREVVDVLLTIGVAPKTWIDTNGDTQIVAQKRLPAA